MTSKPAEIAVSSLDAYVGDILAKGIMKKALEKVGSSADMATAADVGKALDGHVLNALHSFMTQDKARECVRRIKKKLGVNADAV